MKGQALERLREELREAIRGLQAAEQVSAPIKGRVRSRAFRARAKLEHAQQLPINLPADLAIELAELGAALRALMTRTRMVSEEPQRAKRTIDDDFRELDINLERLFDAFD